MSRIFYPGGSVRTGSREEWLLARRTFITASDAAKVLGLSKFGGPMNVWVEKTEPPSPATETAWLEGGRRFERPILEWFADINRVAIQFADPYEIGCVPQHARVGATLDAVRLDNSPPCPIDAKLIDQPNREEWGEAGTDDFPTYYGVQLAIQMAVMDAPFAELAVRFPLSAPIAYRLWRDPETEAGVIDRCERFYKDYIETREPPPVDGSDSYARYLQTRVRQATEAIVPAPKEVHALVVERHHLREQVDTLDSRIQELENQIKAAIGTDAGLKGPNWRATWKKDKDAVTTDYEGIALQLATELTLERLLAGCGDTYPDDDRLAMMTVEAEFRAQTMLLNLAKIETKVGRTGARKLLVRFDKGTTPGLVVAS